MRDSYKQTLGSAGENLACCELRRRGYAILARRYRSRFGEIDVIARDGETIAFVEVKTRSSVGFGRPAEAVTVRKQRRMGLAALDYLVRRGLEGSRCRFDVVSIVADAPIPQVEVVRAAFDTDFAK